MDALYEVSVDRRVVGTCSSADELCALAARVKNLGRLVMYRRIGEWPPGACELGRSVLFDNGVRTLAAYPARRRGEKKSA